MPDDGTGEKKVWRIENLDLVEVPEAQVNNLYNGDCYVIQYTYGGGENIVYFWQGNNCTIDERGASALHAARIDNEELGGSAMQVRVVQGDEPRHFIKMFGGQLVVLNGGKGSGFRNSQQDDTVDDSAVKLFKIKSATGEADSRAVQVAAEGGLTADDAYILCDGKTVIIFAGEEREELQEEVDQALRCHSSRNNLLNREIVTGLRGSCTLMWRPRWSRWGRMARTSSGASSGRTRRPRSTPPRGSTGHSASPGSSTSP